MRSIYSTDYQRAINKLLAARRRARLTQGEVGARLGRDQSFVSKYERRERRLDFVEFKYVCEVLGLDAGTLLEDIGDLAAVTQSKRKNNR